MIDAKCSEIIVVDTYSCFIYIHNVRCYKINVSVTFECCLQFPLEKNFVTNTLNCIITKDFLGTKETRKINNSI